MVFAIDRAGVVGEDGPTHHGMFDLAYTRMVPHMRVLAPSNEAELVHALHTALALGGPFAIRYPRGAAEGVPLPEEPQVLEVGKAQRGARGRRRGHPCVRPHGGPCAGRRRAAGGARHRCARGGHALGEAARLRGHRCGAAQTRLVVTVEGGIVSGGAGEGVLGELARLGRAVPALTLGIPDTFVPQGKADLLLADLGLDPEGIARSIEERMQ